jgi:dTDP-4-amino-4,6-dideoxygalactose transaminase
MAGVSTPYGDDDVDHSSCYVMPVVIDAPAMRDPLREELRRRGVQTSVLYPAIHEFAAYRDAARAPLPRTERAARTQLTLPLYPHLSDADQDHVIEALHDGLKALRARDRALDTLAASR